MSLVKIPRRCMQTIGHPCRGLSTLQGTKDRYNGITVDVSEQCSRDMPATDFQHILEGKNQLG